MANLPSSRKIVKILVAFGFVEVSQKGSHAKYRLLNDSTVRTVIVPMNKKEIPIGTFRSIVRQSGLNKTDFN